MVIVYLVAIIAANLIAARFGAWVTPINAFMFIGLDLVARDKLHESWSGRGLIWKMSALIAAGSILSWILNRRAGEIALASFVAFALAATTDTVVYAIARKLGWTWFLRSNSSNIAGAFIDSLVFPTLAFHGIQPAVTALNFLAKVAGGLLWSLVIKQATKRLAS